MSRLTFLNQLPPEGSGAIALYLCDCGNKVARLVRKVNSGKTTSCGCFRREKARDTKLKHGASGTREYRVWFEMVQRCHNSKHKDYHLYGNRGITVSDSWRECFSNFILDMGERPEGMTVERKDNNLGYSAENCKWATQSEQANNKRTTVRLTYKGHTWTLREWEEATGIPYKVLRGRYQSGWSTERIVTTEKKELA